MLAIGMLGRRLLALVVAVLCIVARLGVEVGGAHDDQVQALASPAVVGRSSFGAGEEPAGDDAPEGLVHTAHAARALACVTGLAPWLGRHGIAPARARGGDPKLPRGPPSFVVS
jgi:hypothetical protein